MMTTHVNARFGGPNDLIKNIYAEYCKDLRTNIHAGMIYIPTDITIIIADYVMVPTYIDYFIQILSRNPIIFEIPWKNYVFKYCINCAIATCQIISGHTSSNASILGSHTIILRGDVDELFDLTELPKCFNRLITCCIHNASYPTMFDEDLTISTIIDLADKAAIRFVEMYTNQKI